jgi:5-methylthioribose kinase
MRETVGIVVFSGFMLLVVGMVVGNLLLALYRQRRQRKAGGEAHSEPIGD